MKRILEKLKLKKKEGASAIEVVISVMILIMLLMFLLDLLMIMWKFSLVSQTATEISRITGIQGGILNSHPAGYPGGANNYMSTTELQAVLRNKFRSSGIADADWEVVFEPISPATETGKITATLVDGAKYDYLRSYNVKITMKYRWNNVSQMIPGNVQQKITTVRPGMSEWKYGYDDWVDYGE